MIKRIWNNIKDFFVSEYKFIIFLLSIYIICFFPVNYYIIIGGGITDVDKKVVVDNEYDSKGSFNLSYVSEMKGTVLSYCLSYIIPFWEREPLGDYKYSDSEDISDIDFRGDIDLKNANASAIKTAYTLAKKDIKEISSRIYVIAAFDEYNSGLKVQDELLSINGKSFDEVGEYALYLQNFKNNDKIAAEIIRDGKKQKVMCTVSEEEDVRVLGVILENVKDYETSPNISFKFKKMESGPSAGLMTTLEIYNNLIKKDITHGLDIAGTGTVDSLGRVGEIGGVKYKLMGAAKGKAKVFLVPRGTNYEEAMKVKKDKNLKIKVIPVGTVKEAIDELNRINK